MAVRQPEGYILPLSYEEVNIFVVLVLSILSVDVGADQKLSYWDAVQCSLYVVLGMVVGLCFAYVCRL